MLQDAVATARRPTRVGTEVKVYVIGVVAFFPEDALNDTVAALGGKALIGTGIVIDFVAVIATFTGFEFSVPANWFLLLTTTD